MPTVANCQSHLTHLTHWMPCPGLWVSTPVPRKFPPQSLTFKLSLRLSLKLSLCLTLRLSLSLTLRLSLSLTLTLSFSHSWRLSAFRYLELWITPVKYVIIERGKNLLFLKFILDHRIETMVRQVFDTQKWENKTYYYFFFYYIQKKIKNKTLFIDSYKILINLSKEKQRIEALLVFRGK